MNKRGVTIIEVVLSVVVFAISILVCLSFFTFAHRIFVRAREQTFALEIAKEVMSTRDTRDVGSCPVFRTSPLIVPRHVDHYVPELDITYHSVFSWVEVDHPFEAPIAGHEYPLYDWYKVMWASVSWHSNMDNVDRHLSLHTIGVESPRHD